MRMATNESKHMPRMNPHCCMANGIPMIPAPTTELTKLKLAPATVDPLLSLSSAAVCSPPAAVSRGPATVPIASLLLLVRPPWSPPSLPSCANTPSRIFCEKNWSMTLFRPSISSRALVSFRVRRRRCSSSRTRTH